jgi:hypothetical protein
MELEQAKIELRARIHNWAQQDFLREVEEGFPLLSLIRLHHRSVGAFILWSNSLTLTERYEMARALTKVPDDLKWHKLRMDNMTSHLRLVPPLTNADKTHPGYQPIDPDNCLDNVTNLLSPFWTNKSRKKSSVTCSRKVGDWKLVTEFQFWRGRNALEYRHFFFRKDHMPPHFSWFATRFVLADDLLKLYGIHAAKINVPSMADSKPMAEAMVKFAEHFALASEPLFAGLGAED